MKSKKGFAIPGIIILILLILIIYFGFIKTGSIFDERCQYFWDVSSISQNSITIHFTHPNTGYGGTACPTSFGTNTHNTAPLNGFNEQTCSQFFGSSAVWQNNGCFLQDDKTWIKDKIVNYSGGCANSATGTITPKTDGFDGVYLSVQGSDAPRSNYRICDFQVNVQKSETQISAPIKIPTSDLPSTDIPSTPQVECLSNMNCVLICGSKTPTCESGICKCSGVPVQVQPQREPNWLDKIGNYVQGILDKIFGVFSK